jgi:membrane-associated protease RseP (regulator of RpoE activity)
MMQLVGNGSLNARQVSAGANVLEAAYYALTPDMLRRIASARSVEFRIVGKQQTITGKWGADLISDAVAFSDQGPQLLGISTTSPMIASAPNLRPAKFGVGYVSVPAQLAMMMKLPTSQGVLVVKVMPDSAASGAGIAAGDVILSFGATPITKPEDLQALVAKASEGEHVAITVERGASQIALDAQF